MIANAIASSAASAGYLGHPDIVPMGHLPDSNMLHGRARLLGGRIDTKAVIEDRRVAEAIRTAGLTFIFRYGAVVSFVDDDGKIEQLDAALSQHLRDPAPVREAETADIVFHKQGADKIGSDGQILLVDNSEARLLLVAIVLSRNVVLSRDEVLVSEAFDRIAPLVNELSETGRTRFPIRRAMRLVGNVLSARHRVMASVQADERPDVLWDNPELDRLYGRLEAEYELDDRAKVLERKFVALGDFAEALLDIVQDKRAFRLELAIIALITFEIVLAILAMHWR